MIHFVVKFLICFSKPKSGVKGTTKKNNPKKEEENIHEDIIQCTEQVRNWCRIEYSLFNNILPNIELNVVTWGPAVKIYAKDDCRAITTYTVGDLVWVNFTMVHNVCEFDDADIESLKDSVITFKFVQNQEEMMESVKNDWPKTFEISKKPDETHQNCELFFSELHQIDPPLDRDYKEVLRERSERFHISRPEKKSISSLIQVPIRDKQIENKMNEILTYFQNDTQVGLLPKKKGNKEKSKAKTVKQTKTNDSKEKSKLTIKYELLIAGKKDIFVEQREITSTLKYAAVYITSSKILTEEQDFTFIPFTITINTIEDLPMKYLHNLKISKIYARYDFSKVSTNIETKKHMMNKDVVFDHTNVFFISEVTEKNRFPHLMLRPSVLSLTEVLMTRYFVLKFYGELETSSEVPIIPCLFRNKPDDEFIATPNHEMFLNYSPPPVHSSEVFLGSACFNLIKLSKGFHTVEMSTVLTPAPVIKWDPAFKSDEIMDGVENQNDCEAILKEITTPGCIPEHLLIKHSTRVTITVSIGTLLSNLTECQLLEMNNIYNRVIMVFKNGANALEVFQHIVEVNTKLGNIHHRGTIASISSMRQSMSTSHIPNLSKSDNISQRSTTRETWSLVSRKLTRTRTQSSLAGHFKEIHRNLTSSNKVLTGFFIANNNESMIVVETIPYVISYVIESIHSLAQDNVHLVHDSSIFFTKRMYGDFPLVKIYTVKLPISINSLIQNYSKYTNSNATALQTLLQLDLLGRSQTLNSASINQLFPSCEQLIMFNQAFGEQNVDLYDESESATSSNK